MIRIAIINTLLLCLVFLNSCHIKEGMIKNPCQASIFLKDISAYSKADLAKLARMLESSSYAAGSNSGCRSALLARVYLAQKRMSLASDYFSKAAKQLPEISEYFLLAKAHVELKKHNFETANTIAQALLDSKATYAPKFSLRVRQVLADIAVEKKDDQQIIKTHQDLLAKGYSENEILLFNLATALTNVGRHSEANEVYKKLLTHFPLSPGAKKVELLRSLAHYNWSLKDVEKRFDKLIEKLAFTQVEKNAALLAKSSSLDDESKQHIKNLAVKSLITNNQFEQGIKKAQTNLKKNPTAKELETYAFSLAKVGRFMDAAEYYGKFFKRAKDKEDKARACFFNGFSLYEASFYSMALFNWQSCHASIKDSSYYENYLWYQSLASMLNSNHNKAIAILHDLKKLFPKSNDTEKYNYFLGVNLNQLNKKTESDGYFQALANKNQPSYYVLLARQTLNLKKLQGVDLTADTVSQLTHNVKNSASKNALILFHLGFKDEAKEVVQASKLSHHDKLGLLQHMGFYNDAYKASSANVTINNGTLNVSPQTRATYALPHYKIISEISKKYAVNKSLLYAIIRNESAFAENALSNRGALGLMQMMPFVAEQLAGHIALDKFSVEHLKNPQISIELGALFVAILQRQFSNPHLVVAAYNAGPHQVQKWLDRFGHLPTELFIERVPFKQTRDYIKKVLSSESLYHAMSGNDLRLAL